MTVDPIRIQQFNGNFLPGPPIKFPPPPQAPTPGKRGALLFLYNNTSNQIDFSVKSLPIPLNPQALNIMIGGIVPLQNPGIDINIPVNAGQLLAVLVIHEDPNKQDIVPNIDVTTTNNVGFSVAIPVIG